MKNISTGLLNFLLSTDVESCYVVDLFTVTLVSGLVCYATDGQLPITFGGNVYLPTRWGSWRCNGTKCALGAMSASADFEVFAGADETMPNWGCTVNEAAQLGLFDAAEILIQTVYMPNWGDTSLGAVIRFGGQITEFTPVGRTSIKGNAKGYTYTLNQDMPRKVLQPSCGWTLGDAGCTVNLATYTFGNTASLATSSVIVTAAATISQASGYFTQGVLKFTTGKNAGLSCAIQTHVGQVLTLSRPALFPVAIGDAFTITAGCDHTALTCQTKFANLVLGSMPNNFGGQPYIPSKETCI